LVRPSGAGLATGAIALGTGGARLTGTLGKVLHCVTDTFCVGPVANDLKLDGLFLFNEGGAGGGIFGLETGGII